MSSVRARVKVIGRVQGVFFRASMREVALANSVTGWVRNDPDGSVEALLDGSESAVEKILEWARHGPLGARVDGIEVRRERHDEELRDFRIIQ